MEETKMCRSFCLTKLNVLLLIFIHYLYGCNYHDMLLSLRYMKVCFLIGEHAYKSPRKYCSGGGVGRGYNMCILVKRPNPIKPEQSENT